LSTDEDLDRHVKAILSGILKKIQSSPRELRSKGHPGIDLNPFIQSLVEVSDVLVAARSLTEWKKTMREVGKKISHVRLELGKLRLANQ
jgi:hypothetical protein